MYFVWTIIEKITFLSIFFWLILGDSFGRDNIAGSCGTYQLIRLVSSMDRSGNLSWAWAPRGFSKNGFGYEKQQQHFNYLANWGMTQENCNNVFDGVMKVAQFIYDGMQENMSKEQIDNKE